MRGITVVLMLLAFGCHGCFGAERRRVVELEDATPVSVGSGIQPVKRLAQKAGNPAEAPAQGSVVLQVFRRGDIFIGWAETVEDLPPGTTLFLFYVAPDDTQIRNVGVRYDQGLEAGVSIRLPDFRDFGPFWTKGLHVFDLWVQLPNGKLSHCAVDFSVGGYYRNADQIKAVVPLIKGYRYEKDDSGVVLVLNGVFTAELPKILLEELVVPPSAITVVNSGEIRINLSLVPKFSLKDLVDFMLTVAQAGWSDTILVRFAPLP